MLARSAEFAVEGLRFEQGDIAEFTARGEYDLVFSNAALHWVEGQEQLMGRLTDALRNGGQVALQVPANFDYPSHTVARELAREEPYREALTGYVREKPVLEPQEYATLLDRLGYREQHVRLQVYVHYLESRGSCGVGEGLAAYRLPEADAGGAVRAVPRGVPDPTAAAPGGPTSVLLSVQAYPVLGQAVATA